MPTTREVEAARFERIRRADLSKRVNGPICTVCGNPLWKPLYDIDGLKTHPTCDPAYAAAQVG